MKLAGAFLALLSAATLLWCDSKATKLPGLPPKVIIFCDVFYGKTFADRFNNVPRAILEIVNTFDKAQELLNKFSKFGTTIELNRFPLRSYEDPSFDFNKAAEYSKSNGSAKANMFIYFSHGESSKDPVLRKEGLISRMCDADKGYRTLLLNRANADWDSQARIIAYYVGTLIGMQNDNSNGCSDGIMDYDYWHIRDNIHWNKCNADDFYNYFVKTGKLSCISNIPDTMIINCDVFYGDTFVNEIGNVEAKSEIKETFKKAQELLNIFSSDHGTEIELNTLSPRSYNDPSFDFNSAVENSKSQGTEKADMFIYFSNETSSQESVLRKWGLKSRMCDADKGYRTLLLNSANADRLSLARIIAYYVGTLIGMGNDVSNGCSSKGIMDYYKWHSRNNLHWNKCNAEDLHFDFVRKAKHACILKPDTLIIKIHAFISIDLFNKDLTMIYALVNDIEKVKSLIKQTFDKAQDLLSKFSKYGTAIKLEILDLWSFKGTKDFKGAVTVSNNGGNANANMFIYFTNIEDQEVVLRKKGLWSRMCDGDKAYRTLMLNKAKADWDSLARIIAYYVGTLIGMQNDNSNGCSDGIMDHNLWLSPRNLRWNNCNANDYARYFAKTYRSSCFNQNTLTRNNIKYAWLN